MNGLSIRLPFSRAARFLAAASFLLVGFAQAQDNPGPADNNAPPPADATPAQGGAPANGATADGSAPADAAPAPASDAAAAQPETVPTIPVDQRKPAETAKSNATQLDTVEVTGSRLRRTDYETSQPVLSLSREDIERTGLTDITQILRHLSVAGNNSLSPQQGRFALTLGETNLDLRNLGANHTLLLVNGRRWVTGLVTTQTSVSDYNTIPTSIIERVEVLKDGASAIYGSDAIGGVVNVITRKDFDGGLLDYHFGEYIQQGDGVDQQASLSWGLNKAKSNLFVNLSFTEQKEAPNENRAITAYPDAGPSRSSIVTPQGLFQFVAYPETALPYQCPNLESGIAAGVANGVDPLLGGTVAMTNRVPAGLVLCQLRLNDGAQGGTGRPLDYHQVYKIGGQPGDTYNRFADGTLVEPNQRIALFTQYRLQLLDNLGMSFEGLYNRRKSTSVGQNAYLGGGSLDGGPQGQLAYISATNPMNPFGQDIGFDSTCPTPSPACTGIGPGAGSWAIRLANGNNNQNFYDLVNTYRGALGFTGDFAILEHPFQWDGGIVYGTSKIEDNLPSVNYAKAGKALGVPGTSCDQAEDGCVPLNVFQGPAGLTPEAIDYVVDNNYQRNRSEQNIAYANFTTEVPVSVLPGPLALAVGVEYRKDKFTSAVDDAIQQGLLRLNTQKNLNGSTNAKEMYVEVGVPLVKDVFLVNALDLDIAGRYSKYPNIDAVTTGKFGVRYQILEELLARASYSTGFRAPSVGELYLEPSQSFDPLADPCADPGTNATADSNCVMDGTPGGGSGNNVVTPYDLWQGNRSLEPETSKNLTYGLVYSPKFIPDLNMNVDFFNIAVDKYVVIGEGQYFLDSCYKTAERNYCGYIHRDGSGTLQYVTTPFFNLASLRTQGVDVGFDYILPLPERFGAFKFTADGSYLSKFDSISPNPGGADQVDHYVGQAGGQFAGYPRWKAGGELVWKREQMTASWTTRMAYTMTEECGDLFPTPSLKDLGLCNYPDVKDAEGNDAPKQKQPTVFYHNVQFGYAFPEHNTDLTLGVNNVLDQNPPISRSLSSLYFYNYDPNAYEVPGRFGYVKVSYKF